MKERETPLDADVLADSIKKLFELSKDNMLNFSGGTYKNPDVMADYWIDLVKKIRAFSDAKIAIEFAPPSDLEKIVALKNAGADVAIMNLEVANDELRKKICPGKSKISYEHYYKAFEKAVSVFGWGQVSSVLIAGVQPKEDIMAECEKMAKIGVFPTVMPIRPLDNARRHFDKMQHAGSYQNRDAFVRPSREIQSGLQKTGRLHEMWRLLHRKRLLSQTTSIE